MLKNLAVLTVLLATSCNLASPRRQEVVPTSKASHTVNADKREIKNEATFNCKSLIRPLNPTSQPLPSASNLDRHFYLAYNHETE
jgi:hypothetical protein